MSRYNGTEVRRDINGRRYKSRVEYTKFPLRESDIYYVTTQGDRLDLLADRYYGTVTKWWVISEANRLEVLSYDLKPGLQLRIPREGY
jgi:nucleoid-associated protein YgaU